MKDNVKNIVSVILVSILIFGFFICNIIKKDNDISISERRKLEKFPEVTIKNIINGTFFSKFDSYTTDQFMFRDNFRKLKINIDMKTKGNYKNIYVYDDYIIEKLYPLNENSVINISDKINYIKDKYLDNSNNVYYTVVPDKNYFIDENNLRIDYDKLLSIMNSKLSNIKYIDIISSLNINDYYKTDTHWKSENLIKIKDVITKNMKSYNYSNYDKKYVTSFEGVYASRIYKNNIKDEVNILLNDDINNSSLYNYETSNYDSLYDMSKIDSLDKYDIYLSGSVSLLDINNDKSNSDKELIVFRDSFGSSLIPLLTSSYRKITIVDTRYISSKILNNYIDFSNKDVLFMYSVLTINDSFSLR